MKFIEKFKEFQKSDNKENFVLQNITFISILILILIWGLFLIQQILCIINNFFDFGFQLNYLDLKFLITTSGAIFAFWYGYKKYEREKELEILEKFILKKYKISSFENTEDIYPWITAVYSYKKGYISKDLFEIVDIENSDFLYYFLKEQLTFKSKNEKDYKIEVDKKTKEISKKIFILNKYELFRIHILGILEKYSIEIKDKNLSQNIKILLDDIKRVNKDFNI